MKLLVVNPNTTASMTAKIAAAARCVARPGTEIVATQPDSGPASIQGFLDIARSHHGLLEVAERHRDADAVVVACFDDTGVDALRCLFDGPVIGIGEAAFHAASLISTRFAVVTTLTRAVPGLRDNLDRYGLSRRCAAIRAAEVPVLDLETNPAAAERRITAEIAEAMSVDRADAIVLGCAGMADLHARLSKRFGLPVIDGVACAVTLAEALCAAGLSTSKAGAYASTANGPAGLPQRAMR
ncbi:aspartate/glutamate racemase family protein [Aestuariicoccus sp. MJ-SS9]|uniref:aspartate/glutamate racemase family protein n=1 Tax=Aestuariicoccus sp. MJ-SS9 TaxID=3079855 RepID=UPI00290B6CFA|nr:aspartate/glutamate racemase family protein [Aestuariicoccus sp. MJ-SS9]MDU8913924.1 aspartate/glutamate racemase family protein [Aestuariicoccus sp. MJ-SS9]